MRVDGEIIDIVKGLKVDRYKTHEIEIVVDRLEIKKNDDDKRLRESINTAMYHGDDVLMVIEHDSQEVRYFSRNLMCPSTGISYPNPEPNNFSFNSPKGACPNCNGIGELYEVNPKKIIPDPKKSIKAGGIEPHGTQKNNWIFKQLELIAERFGFKLTDPIGKIPKDAVDFILYGGNEKFSVSSKALGVTRDYKIDFEGVAHFIENTF